MSFLTGFKKNLNRAGQSIMQKTGISDKTIDDEFAEEYERFKVLEQRMEKLSKEAKGYQNSMRAVSSSQVQIVESMDQFYDDLPSTSCFQSYKKAIQQIDTKMKSDMDDAYTATVVEPWARYCAYFPDINEAIKRRQKKLLDYDNHRIKVRKLIERPSDDPQRLPTAEKEANLAREMYENINSILISDLPKIVELRVPYVDPSFEAMVKSQLLVGQLAYDQLESLRPSFPGENENDDRLHDILQQMRDLSICGNV
ncbi:reduced viability upon starvation protein [Halteromyces radiatus]|uniref:reduced viability upon starvation protein n=1 Tax=Halteromyces radiatus TaxID=101107 RepID=UPI00221F1DDE|nr:reduced viability upon starvation protein [Halteromyces radiatus]KAI8084790.1 reduced viability upon starvation protein [Halteromyces radiatus]